MEPNIESNSVLSECVRHLFPGHTHALDKAEQLLKSLDPSLGQSVDSAKPALPEQLQSQACFKNAFEDDVSCALCLYLKIVTLNCF